VSGPARREQRSSPVSTALLGLIVVVLSSCAETQPQPASQAYAVRPPPHATLPGNTSVVPRPAHKPTPRPSGGSPAPVPAEEASTVTAPNPPEESAAAERVSPSSEKTAASSSPDSAGQMASHVELIGLDQSAATRLFGPATEKSDEPPATVWRYKTAGCELDLFFYIDLRSGRMRTLHYAFKGGAADTARRQECLRSLIASREG
jgi:hypothetical protein